MVWARQFSKCIILEKGGGRENKKKRPKFHSFRHQTEILIFGIIGGAGGLFTFFLPACGSIDPRGGVARGIALLCGQGHLRCSEREERIKKKGKHNKHHATRYKPDSEFQRPISGTRVLGCRVDYGHETVSWRWGWVKNASIVLNTSVSFLDRVVNLYNFNIKKKKFCYFVEFYVWLVMYLIFVIYKKALSDNFKIFVTI